MGKCMWTCELSFALISHKTSSNIHPMKKGGSKSKFQTGLHCTKQGLSWWMEPLASKRTFMHVWSQQKKAPECYTEQLAKHWKVETGRVFCRNTQGYM